LIRRQQQRIFVTDCEGPISKNDNAYELASSYIPEGNKLYALISKYDDVLAEVFKREGYKAGDTLKLILPFLKAYDVTDQKMIASSTKGIMLVAGAKGTMQFVQKRMPSFIVSTSYEHYISALCKTISFPIENTYSTKVNLDKYPIKLEEKETLKHIAKEIARMPTIKIPENAKSSEDLSLKDQMTMKRLDEIFWSQIPKMSLGNIVDEVNPMGGMEKATAVQEIVAKYGCDLDCVLYIGDSITDVACFQLVRNGGGLTVSFNGNEYAVRAAQIAVMSQNTVVTSILADVFSRLGKDSVQQLAKEWSFLALERFEAQTPTMLRQVKQLYSDSLPRVAIITNDNREEIAKESTVFRKKVRGEAIARLG
jgi:energy-converting hydrogenase A subunit R